MKGKRKKKGAESRGFRISITRRRPLLAAFDHQNRKRGYRHAIDEFIQWYCSEPPLSFNRTVVLRYRIHLECRNLAPGTINVRLVPSDDWRTKLRMPDYSAPSSPLASDA